MQDITIKCADCGRDFDFLVSEQQFFVDKGFVNADGTARRPKRCRNCRRQRKQENRADRNDRQFRGMRDEPHTGRR